MAANRHGMRYLPPELGIDVMARKAFNGSTTGNSPTVLRLASFGDFAISATLDPTITVDVVPLIVINQTTAGVTLTLPVPAESISGRIIYVVNNGTASFTMQGLILAAGRGAFFIWENNLGVGSPAWRAMNDTSGGVSGWQQGGNAFSAVGTLGTADNFALRFIVNGLESIRFPTVAAAVNNLQISASPAGGAILIEPIGTDAAIPIHYTTKGSGRHRFYPAANSTTAFQVLNAAQSGQVFNVDTSNTRVGIGTTSPAAGLHNQLATLFGTSALLDFPANGAIGANTATVDIFTSFTINQTTGAGARTLTLPDPSVLTAGRYVLVTNVGSVNFTMHGLSVVSGASAFFVWDGALWRPMTDSAGATLTGFTTGANTGLGVNAGDSITVGTGNTTVGVSAGTAITTGLRNTAVGTSALQSQTGALTDSTAVGFEALLTTGPGGVFGGGNTAVGSRALRLNSVGVGNTALGVTALTANDSDNNTAVGSFALLTNTVGSELVAVGANALRLNLSGIHNVAVGFDSLRNNSIGANNTAMGFSALVANLAASNTALGSQALSANTNGTRNVAAGVDALGSNTDGSDNIGIGNGSGGSFVGVGATDNIAIGTQALTSSTGGFRNVAIGSLAHALGTGAVADNVAIGFHALQFNNASDNIAIGSGALDVSTLGTANIAIGTDALGASSGAAIDNNVAIGHHCLDASTGGTGNVGIGTDALGATTVGTNNVGIGHLAASSLFGAAVSDNIAMGTAALQANTGGVRNVAIGSLANGLGAGTGGNNVALGYHALQFNTVSENVAIGSGALDASTTGLRQVAVGTDALGVISGLNHDSTAVGYRALFLSTGGLNTAVGSGAMDANTGGTANVAVGTDALGNNTGATTDNNVAVGYRAMFSNTLGVQNVGIGSGALAGAMLAGADNNVAVGYHCMDALTTGTNNVAVGADALSILTTGSSNIGIGQSAGGSLVGAVGDNIAIGTTALGLNGGGSQNVAIGTSALGLAASSASTCTAIGYHALQNNTASSNVAVGALALAANVATVGNTAVGSSALLVATASNNVAVGTSAFSALTTGVQSVGIGSGIVGGSVTTGSFNTFVGYGTGGSAAARTGAIAIGISSPGGIAANALTDNGLFFHTSLAVVSGGAAVSVNYDPSTGAMGPSSSSKRFKQDIVDLASMDTSKIYDLRPVDYTWIGDGPREGSTAHYCPDFGYIAEEVVEILPALAPLDAAGVAVAVRYEKIVVLLVAELKKLRDRIAVLEAAS